jgi:hypothetical protein
MPDVLEPVFLTRPWSPNPVGQVMAKGAKFDLFKKNISQKSRLLTYVIEVYVKIESLNPE